MAFSKKENDQLYDHAGTRASAGVETDSIDEKQEILEELADLFDPDSTLIFNDDGTVEIDEELDQEDEV